MKRALVIACTVLGCSAASPDPAPAGGAEPDGWSEPETTEAWTDEAPTETTAPAPARPTPPARPVTASVSGDMKTVLDAHNRYRAQHCAPPLRWSATVAATAQAWAEELRDSGCKFEHSRGTLGENLAAGSAGALSPQGVVDMWYREVSAYDFGNPRFAMDTGHFTQVVWVGTTELGCGVSQCNGMSIWVCNYAPAGNMQGAFAKHVRPKGCK